MVEQKIEELRLELQAEISKMYKERDYLNRMIEVFSEMDQDLVKGMKIWKTEMYPKQEEYGKTNVVRQGKTR